jgi:hypothetical protein
MLIETKRRAKPTSFLEEAVMVCAFANLEALKQRREKIYD